MNEINAYLARLRDKVQQPCHVALLDYLATFPERRLQSFTLAPFCTPKRLAAFRRMRSEKRPVGREAPVSEPRRQTRSLIRQIYRGGWHQTMTFIVFIAANRSHRQYLAVTSGRPVSLRFPCPAELMEFYRYFGCLTEGWPRGNDGFIPPRFLLDLGSYGDLGRTVMAAPPQGLRPYPVVFRGRNGDCAFMDSEGRFRWFGWQRGKVRDIADSFPNFLSEYVRYRSRQDAAPFDAAGRRRGPYTRLDLSVSRLDAELVDREMVAQSGRRS